MGVSVRWLVGQSIRPPITHKLKSWNNAIFQSNLVKLYYETWNYTIWHATKGYWPCWYSPQTSISTITRTSTLENASIVRTLFDLFTISFQATLRCKWKPLTNSIRPRSEKAFLHKSESERPLYKWVNDARERANDERLHMQVIPYQLRQFHTIPSQPTLRCKRKLLYE